jgi:hypothetical protein
MIKTFFVLWTLSEKIGKFNKNRNERSPIPAGHFVLGKHFAGFSHMNKRIVHFQSGVTQKIRKTIVYPSSCINNNSKHVLNSGKVEC